MKTSGLKLFAVGGLLLACAGPAVAQDPVKVAPNTYKPILENNHVRVYEVNFKTGEKVGTHEHPDHVVYILEGGKLKFTHADGKSKEIESKAGQVLWVPAESHQVENTGKTDVRAVTVELRDPAPNAGEATAGVAEKDDAVKLSPESEKAVFENERVRVLESSLKPGGKLPMHGHPASVVYRVSAAKSKVTLPDGKSTEREFAAGTAVWSDAVVHAVENVGTTETRTLIFELKQPVAAKKP